MWIYWKWRGQKQNKAEKKERASVQRSQDSCLGVHNCDITTTGKIVEIIHSYMNMKMNVWAHCYCCVGSVGWISFARQSYRIQIKQKVTLTRTQKTKIVIFHLILLLLLLLFWARQRKHENAELIQCPRKQSKIERERENLLKITFNEPTDTIIVGFHSRFWKIDSRKCVEISSINACHGFVCTIMFSFKSNRSKNARRRSILIESKLAESIV